MHRLSTLERVRLMSLPLLVAGLLATGCDDPSSTTGATSGTGSAGGGGSGVTSGSTGVGGAGGGADAPPGIVFLDVWGAAMDITPDGRTVLVQALDTGEVFFYDTLANELTLETTVGDPQLNSALGISSDRRVIASEGQPSLAGIWSETNGWLSVGQIYPSGCDFFVSDGWDLSADGKIGVGMVWNGCRTEAFRWTDTGGQGDLQILQVLGAGDPEQPSKAPSNRASKISDNGKVIGGFAENYPHNRTPAVWNADGSGFLLDPANTNEGEVMAVSADGTIVGGYLGYDAFTWTAAGGLVMLVRPSESLSTDRGLVNAVVADGALAFGRFSDPWVSPTVPFVSTPIGGTRDLRAVAYDAGIVIPPEYTVWNVTGASTDGSVVVGMAFDGMGRVVPWVLRMPVSAYAR